MGVGAQKRLNYRLTRWF